MGMEQREVELLSEIHTTEDTTQYFAIYCMQLSIANTIKQTNKKISNKPADNGASWGGSNA